MLGKLKKAITTDKHEAALAANAAALAANAAAVEANPLNGILDRDPGVVTAQQKLAALLESASDCERRIADLAQRAEAVPSSETLVNATAEDVGEVVRLQMEAASNAAAELARQRIQAKWLQDAIAQQRSEVDNAYRRAATAEIRQQAGGQYEALLNRMWAASQELLAAAEAERRFLAINLGGKKTAGHLVRAVDHALPVNTNNGSYRAQHERLKLAMAKRHNPS